MADLPKGWAHFTLGNVVPTSSVVFNGYTVPIGQFNVLSAIGMFTNTAVKAKDPTTYQTTYYSAYAR